MSDDVFDGDASNNDDLVYVWSRSRDLKPPYAHVTVRMEQSKEFMSAVSDFMYEAEAREFHSTHEVLRTAQAIGFMMMRQNPKYVKLSKAAQILRQAELLDRMQAECESRQQRLILAQELMRRVKTTEERDRATATILDMVEAETDREAAEELRRTLR